MSGASVMLAVYERLAAAASDWDELGRSSDSHSGLIDAAVLEWSDDKVIAIHRCSTPSAWGHGTVATALVGVLWPPALLTGAIAGGVGDEVLTCLTRGLTNGGRNELGRVLRSRRFVLVVVSDLEAAHTCRAVLSRAVEVSTVETECSEEQLLVACAADQAAEHGLDTGK